MMEKQENKIYDFIECIECGKRFRKLTSAGKTCSDFCRIKRKRRKAKEKYREEQRAKLKKLKQEKEQKNV